VARHTQQAIAEVNLRARASFKGLGVMPKKGGFYAETCYKGKKGFVDKVDHSKAHNTPSAN